MQIAKSDFPQKELTEKIIAAAIEVHRTLGPGFTEDVYEEALAHELDLRSIAFARQLEIDVAYKTIIAHKYRLDFAVEEKVIVELKAVNELRELHTAQVLAYLKASGFQVGLLLNFNVGMMRDGIRRIVLSKERASNAAKPDRQE